MYAQAHLQCPAQTALFLSVSVLVSLVADLIADVAMARQGFPRTGISACFGGPLFSILLSLHQDGQSPLDVLTGFWVGCLEAG